MEPETQDARGSILAGRSVVIVEDEGVTQLQLRRILRSAGLRVVAAAASGAEGVEAAMRERPDIILMDVRMPGEIDGLEAARRILERLRVCIVMLTAFNHEDYRSAAEAIDVCGYIVKPVSSETLVPKLEGAMRNYLGGAEHR